LKAAELARARAESRAAEERKRRLLTAGLAVSLLALAVLGIGGGFWLAQQRAAREAAAGREARTALREASLLLGKARSAPKGDLTLWAETTQAAKRAEAMLARPELGSELRREIQDVVAMASRERDQAESLSKDRRMLERLAAIHTEIAADLDFGRADRAHAAAFSEYGIDVNQLSPAAAGARIAASPVAIDLVNALDQWTFVRRMVKPQDGSWAGDISAVAKAADPDPWRCRLRDLLELEGKDRTEARGAFEELAAAAPQDVRYRESLSRLAYALGSLGDKESAIALLRRVQRAHADDFWINHDLARSLMSSGQPDEAIRFYSVALAIRPTSQLAQSALGEALRAAGRTDEATMYPRARRGRAAHVPQAPDVGVDIDR
jgi:tetratricopeptide (TPR) repeat protein